MSKQSGKEQIQQLNRVNEKDLLGIKFTYLSKNNLKGIFYSEDFANLTCVDTNILQGIRQKYQNYKPEF